MDGGRPAHAAPDVDAVLPGGRSCNVDRHATGTADGGVHVTSERKPTQEPVVERTMSRSIAWVVL